MREERWWYELIQEVDNYLFDNLIDGQYTIKKLENGTSIKHPLGVRLTGSDEIKLFAIADEIKQKLATLNGTVNIQDDWGLSQKRLELILIRSGRSGLGLRILTWRHLCKRLLAVSP